MTVDDASRDATTMGVAVDALNQSFLRDYPREAARAAERLPAGEVAPIISGQSALVLARIWSHLLPDAADQLLSALPDDTLRALLVELDTGRCAAMLRRLPTEMQTHCLSLLTAGQVGELQRMMQYPADSAGAMMEVRTAALRGDMTAGDALDQLRSHRPRSLRSIYLLDDDGRLEAIVDIQDMAMAEASQTLAEIAHPVTAVATVIEPRDEVLERLERNRLEALPVVDISGRLLGVIHAAEMMRAIQEESSSDMQAMVGVSREERALSPPVFAVRKRVVWMHVNLVTAFAAASVVGLFEATIAQFTALAVLMPVVAGMAGNSGQQALAVTMRGLVLHEIGIRHWLHMAFKELRVGVLNGTIIAFVTAMGVWWWSGSSGLALVIGLAMVISMVIACVCGAMVPIVLTRLRQDPALSSSIFLTTATDIFGFLSFLGIATLLSGLLVAS